MDRLLRPKPFNVDPSSPTASKEWSHWKTKFQKVTASIKDVTDANKHDLLINYLLCGYGSLRSYGHDVDRLDKL